MRQCARSWSDTLQRHGHHGRHGHRGRHGCHGHNDHISNGRHGHGGHGGHGGHVGRGQGSHCGHGQDRKDKQDKQDSKDKQHIGQTKLTLKLDFPGNSCREAFAILAMLLLRANRSKNQPVSLIESYQICMSCNILP